MARVTLPEPIVRPITRMPPCTTAVLGLLGLAEGGASVLAWVVVDCGTTLDGAGIERQSIIAPNVSENSLRMRDAVDGACAG